MSAAARSTPLYDVCGFVDFSERGKIELTGDDRAKFLHNLCTNDIKGLAAGTGCEAMLLDAKGHVQFYVLVHNAGDRLLLEELAPTEEQTGARLRKHLDKYLIREKVIVADLTATWGEILVAGDGAVKVVADALKLTPPIETLGNVACPDLGDGAFVARSVQATAPNFSIFCRVEAITALKPKLVAGGAIACELAAWQPVRIESRLPLYGVDVSEKNLAQEIDRIDRTINFRKGCYLGQETVARLDALGHVNKTLVQVAFRSDAPVAIGTELTVDGKSVGQVTSTAVLPHGPAVALAYVKRGMNEPGAELESAAGPAVIVRPV
jgi:folate-binding protein YgfZ